MGVEVELFGPKRNKPSRGQQRIHTDLLANERDRERGLRDLLSNKKQEDSLSQQDRNGHCQFLSSSCEWDNRDLGRTTSVQHIMLCYIFMQWLLVIIQTVYITQTVFS